MFEMLQIYQFRKIFVTNSLDVYRVGRRYKNSNYEIISKKNVFL